MHDMNRKRLFVALAVLAVPPAFPVNSPAKDSALLSMRAFAVNMGGGGRTNAGTIDIVVERWTTDEERAKLRGVLIEKGSDALLDALQDLKPRAGYVRTSQSLGWDVQFAREIPLPEGGRRIILATDRPMSFVERRNQPRSADYEYLLIEARLDKDGKGQGKMAGAAKVTFNKETNTLEIENYGIEPVRLTEITVIEPKQKK